jgi:hypothetical protein
MLRVGSNSPTVQNGALTFDRGLKQFMNFGPLTYNIATQGISIVWRGQFTGTAGNWERIFESSPTATNSAANYNFFLGRSSTSSTVIFRISKDASGTLTDITSGTINQNTTYVITAVYNPNVGSGTLYLWVNGVPVTPVSSVSSLVGNDRLNSFNFIGVSTFTGDKYLSASTNTFAIYNRALSNVEIYNSYLALTTTPVGRTLEIGDINGTPALSVAGDGKVSVQSVGLSSNVVPWPPSALSGYDTVINGGVYKARASTEFSPAGSGYPYAWYAFDKSATNYWVTNSPLYSSSSPYAYTGTVTTTDVNGTIYPGEWVQIQKPVSTVVSSYVITCNGIAAAPRNFVILGSRDGVNWFLVDSESSVTWTGVGQSLTFSVQSTQAFSYYRAVTRNIQGNGTYVQFIEWTLYGTADTSPSLTIAPATTFSSSVATPALTGISGDRYVPQDFSSSGLNVPAYVVSNTTTVANTVAYSSFGPFAGEGSVYFPGGTGSYVNFGNQLPLWTGGNQDATIEAWVYIPAYLSTYISFFTRPASTTSTTYDWNFYMGSSGTVYFNVNASITSGLVTSGTALPLNTWVHIAATVKSSVLSVFINGVLTGNQPTISGTVNYHSNFITMIGNYTSATGYMMNGYISNFRVVQGQALYTTTFTPPTGPLQPIQGTTQAGLPYGTVLLLRNAPAPGRVLTSKFGGANSGGINGAPLTLSFPPAAMTSYATALSSGYGQGVYVASASSEAAAATTQAWKAFERGTFVGNYPFWQCVGGYSGSTGAYNYVGSNVSVDVTGTSYAGEWLQIQMPSSIVLSNYVLSSDGTSTPVKWWILGSRDGTSWSLVDSRTTTVLTSSTPQTFSPSASQAFTYFRMVIGISYNSAVPAVYEWTLNGQIEAINITNDGRVGLGVVNPTRALEVAGDVVCGGTLSAGNPLMFRNRIINGDFRVDQRGSATSVPTAGYGPDRWQLSSSSSGQSFKRYTLVAASDDVVMKLGYKFGVQINRGTGGLVDIVQNIELGNCSDMFSQPMMLSFWGRASVASDYVVYLGVSPSGTSSVTYSAGVVYYLTTNWQYITLTIPTPVIYSTSTDPTAYGMQITLRAGSGSPNSSVQYYTGVQLEKGSVATPYEIRPYATELALCQRYYQRFQPSTSGGQRYIATGCIMGAATAGAVISLPVGLRSNLVTMYNNTGGSAAFGSALTIGSSEIYFYNGGTNFIPTTVTLSSVSTSSTEASTSTLYLNFGSGSGGSAGIASMLLVSGTNAFFAFGAEL